MNATMDRNKFFSKLIGQGKKDMLAVVNEMERNKHVWGYDTTEDGGYDTWLTGLLESLELWLVTRDSAVVCFDVNEDDMNLKVVMKNSYGQLSMYRFFTLGSQWECSVDIPSKLEGDFIKELIQKI